jgi:Protein of unknown function (DUF5818)
MDAMKNFLIRILLGSAVTLAAFALTSSMSAQQADQDPARATPHQAQPSAVPQSPQQEHDAPVPSSDAQTQEALAFTGRVAKEQGQLVLKDPVTKMNYQLDGQAKAKPYLGKQVKITGKLEMRSNTIHIDSIEPVS